MLMNLFREICEVLDEAAVEYTTGTAAGSDVIFIGDEAIIPAGICAHSIEEAISEASRHKDSVSEILKLKGKFSGAAVKKGFDKLMKDAGKELEKAGEAIEGFLEGLKED